MNTTRQPNESTANMTTMERVALMRLRRFSRLADVAEQSDSPLWRALARQAASSATRDYLLMGMVAERNDAAVSQAA